MNMLLHLGYLVGIENWLITNLGVMFPHTQQKINNMQQRSRFNLGEQRNCKQQFVCIIVWRHIMHRYGAFESKPCILGSGYNFKIGSKESKESNPNNEENDSLRLLSNS